MIGNIYKDRDQSRYVDRVRDKVEKVQGNDKRQRSWYRRDTVSGIIVVARMISGFAVGLTYDLSYCIYLQTWMTGHIE
jgi:hypothetical protein